MITCIIFNLKDVLETYFLHVKNLSTRQENAEQGIDFPALTLCLQPSLQKSALDNLNIQPITFAHGNFSKNLNFTPSQLYENVSYILNRNFKILMNMTLNPHLRKLQEGQNVILDDSKTPSSGKITQLKLNFSKRS